MKSCILWLMVRLPLLPLQKRLKIIVKFLIRPTYFTAWQTFFNSAR